MHERARVFELLARIKGELDELAQINNLQASFPGAEQGLPEWKDLSTLLNSFEESKLRRKQATKKSAMSPEAFPIRCSPFLE